VPDYELQSVYELPLVLLLGLLCGLVSTAFQGACTVRAARPELPVSCLFLLFGLSYSTKFCAK
jgi:hypothetical protein